MARSLNKVLLIGNLTRDPELRYTPQGTAVCSFGLATNRQWVTESGEKKEDVEFHRLVAWNKLAEICAQLLKKGRKVFIEGRLQTRSWTGQDGTQRSTTEVVVSDMVLLDQKREGEILEDFGGAIDAAPPADTTEMPDIAAPVEEKKESKAKPKDEDLEKEDKEEKKEDEDSLEDIPF